MSLTIEVVARPEVSDDLRALSSNDLRVEALRYIVKLRTKPFLGQRLENVFEIGDLSDCFKIYFDHARHRIVYRLLPDEAAPTKADVIVVGRREGAQVYIEAVRRLGRAPSLS